MSKPSPQFSLNSSYHTIHEQYYNTLALVVRGCKTNDLLKYNKVISDHLLGPSKSQGLDQLSLEVPANLESPPAKKVNLNNSADAFSTNFYSHVLGKPALCSLMDPLLATKENPVPSFGGSLVQNQRNFQSENCRNTSLD